MSDLCCPACGAQFDLVTVFAAEADRIAVERLIAVGYPLGAHLLRYIQLFQPTKQRLTLTKKTKLLQQLLPDIERQMVAYKGRDFAAPRVIWMQAIEQMLTNAARLELPMTQHNYLYAIISGLAEKEKIGQGAGQAAAPEPIPAQQRPDVQYVRPDPAFAAHMQERAAAIKNAVPMPPELRERFAKMRRGDKS